MDNTIFELKDLYFSYLGKIPALCGIDINIKQGEKISVIGANGTGKSTLLHVLDGLIFPQRGSIKAFGEDLTENAFCDEKFSINFRSKVGLVFQNPDIQLFCPTVKEDICFGPLQLGIGIQETKRRLDRLVEILAIKHLLDRPPHQLSVGEKRKVAIASTLAIEPEVIILDEPTAGLDPMTTRHIIDFLLEANLSGKTLISSTHDLHIIEEISDKIYVFGPQNKIIRSGLPQDLLTDANFLEENNLIHIHRHQHKDKLHTHPHYHIDHH